MKIKNLSIILIITATTLLWGDSNDEYELTVSHEISSYDYNGNTYVISVDVMDYYHDRGISHNTFIFYTLYYTQN